MTAILYLDASAIVTKVTGRKHARALAKFMQDNPTAKPATSVIGFCEAVRGCHDYGDYPNLMQYLASEYTKILLTDRICDLTTYMPKHLKTMDAIHVASATDLGRDLLALVTYDDTMARVARHHGLPVAMPGRAD